MACQSRGLTSQITIATKKDKASKIKVPLHEHYDVENRFQSFVLFDPASQRIDESDILARGMAVKDMFDQAAATIFSNDSIENLIIQNRLTKIQRMLDLVSDYNHVIISKFFDRIWRRYSYLSNLGESFLDLRTYYAIFDRAQSPELLMATRFDGSDDDELSGGTPDLSPGKSVESVEDAAEEPSEEAPE